MDFYRVGERLLKRDKLQIYPDFRVNQSKDIMIRGGKFYSIWNANTGLWSQNEYDVATLVDEELTEYKDRLTERGENSLIITQYLGSYSSKGWREYKSWITSCPDSFHLLDETVTFANTEVRKEDYVSRRLPYRIEVGDISAYDELVSVLYDPPEREKLEWAVGSIIAGDSKRIQKFFVLYGTAGSGKSTYMGIIQSLFPGYYGTFDAKSLVGGSNAFSMDVFRENPLIAIQHDGDLSRIEDNSKLNSIISHEEMTMNEKFKSAYTVRLNAFLFMGSNKPVRITDAKSGIIRRLIDVRPTGETVPVDRYEVLLSQIQFELGAVAQHCLDVYKRLGKNYYKGYRPYDMMMQTNVFYNFIEEYFDQFVEQDGVALSQAYRMYKEYCQDSLIENKLPLYKFREELKNYFEEFHDRTQVNGERFRNYYKGFTMSKFYSTRQEPTAHAYSLSLDDPVSLLDDVLGDCPAQYANSGGTPLHRWATVDTTLSQIDTSQLHYVKPPTNHIVIDFDLTNEKGEKDAQLNIEAASKWPETYAEFSQGGSGVHLHYIWDGGDPAALARVFEPGIEIKVFTGDSSLRRLFRASNGRGISTIASGLPLRVLKKVIDPDVRLTEKTIRDMIVRNLRKEIHPATKPSVDFIKKILDDAYAAGTIYDVSDMRGKVLNFAMKSTNQSDACITAVTKMKFTSATEKDPIDTPSDGGPMVFFDCEVFPNLFVVSWKRQGDPKVIRMINPSAKDIEDLAKLRLVGFNNRKYDNHILYGRMLGYDNEQLYKLSKKLISGARGEGTFREAYNLSYADVYDFMSKKTSLKKLEIALGIFHLELGLDWDQPVDPSLWTKVAEYCDNDVIALEAVFDHLHADFVAREILSRLSGLPVNSSTQQHTARIIFGNDRNPQEQFVYRDLSEEFPGYTHEFGKSLYRGEDPEEGGYVYAEEGMYTDVALLDIASMHPTSAIVMGIFGKYTKNFEELLEARLAIKNKDFDKARTMLDGALAPYLKDESEAKALAYALKIVINIVYGLTSAKFPNMFRDERNVDNIVAKRGALFMINLKHEVQERGFTVAHIKTDSIKIPNATPEIIEFVTEYGKKYGYTFEHEATYEKMCLVNKAVYIAKKVPEDGSPAYWEAVGTQFQQPYVFKTLFSKEAIEPFDDMAETKSVTTALYLDFDEGLGEDKHDLRFIGKVGQFTPVLAGNGGGRLVREKDGAFHSASGAKDYRWKETFVLREVGDSEVIDRSYYDKQVDEAVSIISKFGDFEWFAA